MNGRVNSEYGEIEIGSDVIAIIAGSAAVGCFGVGAGTSTNAKSPNAGGGLGGKVTPTAVLVISGGNTKMVNVKTQDGLTRILDMVPDFINRFSGGKSAADAPAGETAAE